MLRKLALLGTVTGFVIASTLVPLETQAGGHGWSGDTHSDGRHAPRFTVITEPRHQVHLRPNY